MVPGNPDVVDTLGVEPHPFRHPSFYVDGRSDSGAGLLSHSCRPSDGLLTKYEASGNAKALALITQMQFPGFYRYALIMEEASEAERNKASRPYDGMAQFSEQHKQLAAQLLTTAATLQRGYQAFLGSGNLQVFQPQVNALDKLHRQWLSDLESFKSSLRAQGAEPKALAYVNEAFGRLAERLKKLAG